MSVVANVAINVDSSGAVSKLRQVQTQAQATEKAFGALQSAIGALGVGFALTKVIADVRELDTNLRRLGTVGVDVGKISPALSKLSDELGGVASKAELAAASYQAASAGFSDTAGNINILRAATKAATGGLADTQAVTEVLVKTLNSYGMSGNQAIQVTDSISKAVELGNQEWSDYTSQLGRVASIAALAGVSLDEVNAFIASATKNGATAEIAFTGLGATLNTLLQPTKESQEAAAKLGIAWNYGGLQAKGFTGLMAELAVAMEKDKETTAKLLGSQEAMRGAFAANAKGGSDYKMVLGELSNAAGKTDADFQTMKGSLDNQLKALDTAFKSLSEALGAAFGPTIVASISDAASAVNGIAEAINAMPQPLKTATAETVKLIAQFLLLQKAIQITIGLQTALAALTIQSNKLNVATTAGSSAFALYANNAAALAPKVAGTSVLLGNLKAAMLAIPGAGWTAAAILGLGLLGKAVFDTNETFRNFVNNIGGVIASDFRSAVDGMADDARTSAGNIQKAYEELPPGLSPIAKFIRELFQGAFKDASNAAETSAAVSSNAFNDFFNGLASQGAAGFNGLSAIINNWWSNLPAPIRNIFSGNAVSMLAGAAVGAGSAASRAAKDKPERQGPYVPERLKKAPPKPTVVPNATNTPVNATVGGGGGGAGAAASDAKRAADEAAREAQRVADVVRDQQFITKQLEVQLRFANEIFEAEQNGDAIRVLNLQTLEQQVLAENDIAQAMGKEADSAAKLAIAAAGRVKLQAITNKGVQDVIALQAQQEKNFDAIIADLNLELALKTATTEQEREQLRIAAERAKLEAQLKGLPQPQIDQAIALQAQIAAPLTDVQKIDQYVGKLKDEIADLTSISNIAITSAEGIGNAFAQSFQGLISGTMTAKEALGSFFKSVADMFLEMAAQIIAKQITMLILQTILKALGAVGGGGGSSSSAAGFGGSFDAGIPAIGNTTDFSGAFKMRAMGGPVASGTPYLVGERGPELFMPGTGGSVVNNNDLRSAMGGRPGGANGSPVLNMSFQSTTINGVEYVSRDQLEAAMAQTRRQAAKDGANRGMNMTLDKIQNSPSTRSRVGIR